jgi:gliding motility-associated-like protein
LVSNEFYCSDSIEKSVYVAPEVTYFLPNAFTPNYDGINDIFVGKGFTQYIKDFHLTVFNRWGEVIFSTNDVEEGWNGSKFNKGTLLPIGVYLVVYSYRHPKGFIVSKTGYITLL